MPTLNFQQWLLGVGLAFASCFLNDAHAEEFVRIAMLKQVPSVQISGRNLHVTYDWKKPPAFLSLHHSLTIQSLKRHLHLNDSSFDASTFEVYSDSGFVFVNKQRYRGRIRLIYQAPYKLLVVNALPVEDYLVGLINQEMSSRWPLAAVKAQAVAARTYALHKQRKTKKRHYDLESSVLDQVYRGSRDEDERSAAAVRLTHGQVLTYGGKLIPAFFHSTCGGKTEAPEYVWGNAGVPMPSVRCDYCAQSPHYYWSTYFSLDDLERRLKKAGVIRNDLVDMKLIGKTPSGRARAVRIATRGAHSKQLSLNRLRAILGYARLKSTHIRFERKSRGLVIHGSGFGHGVGMCQWGAKGMAEQGYSYQQILKHYFPKATVTHLSP